jgi:hypothetical protein
MLLASRYLTWLGAALATPASDPGPGDHPSRAVIGYATGYGAAELEPFVRSLRAHFDGAAALMVDDRPDVRRLLAEYDIEAAEPLPEGAWSPHAVMRRFAAYDAWLARRPWIRDVLLTDVRDVVFQGDPFARPARGLEVYSEIDGSPLARHAFNMKHMRALFGPALTGQLSDRACICVGTLFGPAEAVRRLCRTMLLLAAIPRSEVGGAFGADQAACNLAVHMGLVEADIRPNHERVATIGDRCTLHWRDDGLLVNPNGTISPVIHQYDRHPELTDRLRERWGRPEFSVAEARKKTFADRRKRLAVSVSRRLPELR